MPSFLAVRSSREGEASIETMRDAELPAGGVDLAISHSAIGRLDASTATNPSSADAGTVLGMDLAGVVTASDDARWRPGDAVIATGRGLGRRHHGGWAERARIPGDWLLPQPPGLTPARAMAIGTAGLAAMEAAIELDHHGVLPESGPALVTGASGGVGSLAIVALAAAGFAVTGATSRPSSEAYLRGLGADDVIEPPDHCEPEALGPERWSAAVDVLGGPVLSRILPCLRRSGAVAIVGAVAGEWVRVHVDMFTRRGIALLGVDAIEASRARRTDAWDRWAELAQDPVSAPRLDLLTTTIRLKEAPAACRALLAGELQGRVVIDVLSSGAAQQRLPH